MKNRMIQETGFDELRVLGVRSQGFGQLPRALMVDRTLSICARGVAAYFYSYTGAGSSCAFPSREKILHDLGISKDIYYECLHELVGQGYLLVQRRKTRSEKGFGHNVYTLINYPKKYMVLSGESNYLKQMLALIREGEDMSAGGYGNVPKLVMADDSLSIKAKALYALMCAFSGESGVALPDQKTVLYYTQLSEATYMRRMRELEQAGLICRRPHRVGGRFGGTEVQRCSNLCRTPAEALRDPDFSPHRQNKDKQPEMPYLPDLQNKDKQNPEEKSPYRQNKDEQVLPDVQEKDEQSLPEFPLPDVQEKDINKNNPKTKTNFNSNNLNHSLFAREEKIKLEPEIKSEGETDEAELLEEAVEEGTLPYAWCFQPKRLEKGIRMLTGESRYDDPKLDAADRQLYALFAEALCDMLRSDTPSLTVKGRELSYAKVYKQLAPLVTTGIDEFGEPYAELPFLFDYVSARYKAARSKIAIHSAERYLPAVIWTEISSGELEVADRIAYGVNRRA